MLGRDVVEYYDEREREDGLYEFVMSFHLFFL